MPEVARKDSTDTVSSPDGSGFCCGSPSTQSTDKGSDDVFVNNIGVVREGDAMITHNYPGPCCNPHAPTLSTFSSTVFVNNKAIGRKGDEYSSHIITSGSADVFAG